MPAYQFQQRYRSSYGQGDEGDQVELSEAQAADINRDSPGTLAPVVEEPVEEPEADDEEPDTRALDAPPKNRQVTGGRKRGQKPDGDA